MRGRGGYQCEREASIGGLPLLPTLTVDGTCNLGLCPHWESNPQPSGVWDDTPIT